jgi:hypothetical protein
LNTAVPGGTSWKPRRRPQVDATFRCQPIPGDTHTEEDETFIDTGTDNLWIIDD